MKRSLSLFQHLMSPNHRASLFYSVVCASEKETRFSAVAGACMIPHPDKAHKGGEDAWFISDDHLTCGVADGVGGWADVGVDPGIYSSSLMTNAKSKAQSMRQSGSLVEPLELIKFAHQASAEITGSSTAVVCSIDPYQGILRAANFGDSGFIVMRDGALVACSMVQEKSFNFPYQMGTHGDDISLADTAIRQVRLEEEFDEELDEDEKINDYQPLCWIQGQKVFQKRQELIEPEQFPLQHDDYLILFTDGVGDNLWPFDIIYLMKKFEREENVERLAEIIANEAFLVSKSHGVVTPFSKGLEKTRWEHGPNLKGGKMDDITVVVCKFVEK
eukprot:CAMPEP_0201549750 /NCGR_PEP_ID=MMETSP0173_2-20130828/6201_1 /ASSEMBLY_ACC=CAM_ASM_000268 /TAXON_ID=218659 /ORGANISM="Vexillifera sp., Strain DIVA3 564/2" /LENGTH=330 /DNA_ID=CAMNT_0047959539 /DNA_START=16 /DNA_END=1008 /DNA_ORIENTATION=-